MLGVDDKSFDKLAEWGENCEEIKMFKDDKTGFDGMKKFLELLGDLISSRPSPLFSLR